ncbi:hypothetical protein [Legionella jamestowniensis]|uniref:Uncharacterized protein n=1 Tax=Legionella jamestowniensis TaxID=455 RepID=A0A0W0UIX1_9GAMM|nr:hypothetical protein [Legionella jamestowniensis]KTD07781.1 hypothetical protein Ljam_1976 [Legionella jamestowniensis]OCH99512.1 hypothetical protein A8135_07490 [Legionella jamestowniensis]SFL62090.1 hypothetical protein SAMN02746073_1100 [Legionella jamestowniensis DSM 19215]
MRILHVFDFDETITIHHTAKKPDDYNPETNIKEGLKGNFVHNNESLFAIATFHSQPDYVLSYALALLEKTEEDIIKTEVVKGTHHQLLNVYLKGNEHPLIIGTPRLDNYRVHLELLVLYGKNNILDAIEASLPPCHEKHYYEDKEPFYSKAACKTEFHRHHTNAASASFTPFIAEKAPDSIFSLRAMVNAHLADLPKQESGPSQPGSLVNLSMFAPEKDSIGTIKPSTEDSLEALTDLLDFLEYKVKALQSKTLDVLAAGSFKDILAYWETQTKEQIAPFIAEIEHQREEMAKLESTLEYDSDDNNTFGIGV